MGVGSGGARSRSGPAPDPQALRRDRKDDADWVTLPAEGFTGVVPRFPLSDALGAESDLWTVLWRKPQAFMWAKLGLEFEVAAYVRTFLESSVADASAGLKTVVMRQAAEIGLSLPGMHSLRWKFAEDELGARREVRVQPSGSSVKDRMRALK